MIKVTSKIEAAVLDAITDELIPFDLPQKVGKRVLDTSEQVLLSSLQVMPGPVARPIEWTSERQRRAFFATNGFGHGIPYRRTGRLARSWKVRSAIQEGRYRIIVENTASQAAYVYGTLNMRSLNEAMKPQQRFHRNTGWLTAQPIVKKWTETARRETERAVSQEIELIRTRIRRRSRRSF